MNLISAGIYTIRQAAALLEISQARLRSWVSGKHTMKSGPLIESDLDAIDHEIALSFINLIEIKFVSAFSAYGVAPRSIREMAIEAKRFLNHPHPFATDMLFRTDGRKIFIQAAEKTGDIKLYDLKGKNWGLYEILMDGLKKDLIFGQSGVATGWYPRRSSAPDILLHPKIAFGQPALRESGVPSSAIYDAYVAEDEDVDSVARWFDVPNGQVVEAVNFHMQLRATH